MPVTTLKVRNTGDRPVQVGSHFHFFEVNRALEFDRAAAFGQHLNIPASTAMRFEPGDEREVKLVPYLGKRAVYGFNNLVDGADRRQDGRGAQGEGGRAGREARLPLARREEALSRRPAHARTPMATISRNEYVGLFGPTTGDRIRLGDTGLFVEIERDLRGAPGDEIVFGGGKSLREGMGMDNRITRAGGAPDLVITNVTIIDAVLGVVKADVGIKDGRICGIGKAGNPQMMDGVTPGLECGLATDAISGEHLILTAAGIDTHIHFISPQQAYAALSNGTTTLIGGGTGPSDGSNATTVTPGPGNIRMMLRAFEGWPVNVGILGKGHGHGKAALVEQIEAGAVGFKCHEDWGTTPAVLRSALTVADEMDVQVCIHTDTLNESGFVEDTIAAFEGRTIHSFHTEGSGGGHAPDIIRISALPNVLPSSTNPDAALRHQLAGRAVRHDHGVPPPQPRHPVGRGVHREPHPRRDDRRRERAARPRRDLDDVERLAGDGPHRRVLAAHHPDRRRDEDRARQAAGGREGQRQLPRAALRGEDHDQPGDRARHLARARLGRGRQDRRPRAVGARRSSAPSPSSCSRTA